MIRRATLHPRSVASLSTNPITEALTTKRHFTIRSEDHSGSALSWEFG